MKRIFSLLFLFCSLVFVSCHKERHFISDEEYRAQVHEDFLKRKDLAANRADQLFAGMDTLDTETREALEFLYAATHAKSHWDDHGVGRRLCVSSHP